MDECPLKEPVKEQVRFNLDYDLGDDPSLSMDLTTFLEGGTAKEWDKAPSPSVPLTVDPPQLPHDNGHQCQPTHPEGASLKDTVKTLSCCLILIHIPA